MRNFIYITSILCLLFLNGVKAQGNSQGKGQNKNKDKSIKSNNSDKGKGQKNKSDGQNPTLGNNDVNTNGNADKPNKATGLDNARLKTPNAGPKPKKEFKGNGHAYGRFDKMKNKKAKDKIVEAEQELLEEEFEAREELLEAELKISEKRAELEAMRADMNPQELSEFEARLLRAENALNNLRTKLDQAEQVLRLAE